MNRASPSNQEVQLSYSETYFAAPEIAAAFFAPPEIFHSPPALNPRSFLISQDLAVSISPKPFDLQNCAFPKVPLAAQPRPLPRLLASPLPISNTPPLLAAAEPPEMIPSRVRFSSEPKVSIPSSAATIAFAQKPALKSPQPPLPKFPTLDDLATDSHSDDFDIEFMCLPKENGPGYFFAVTLVPKSDLNLPKMRQHYSFLIDRSNSIQRERLLASKNAVLKALDELSPEDTFNIFVFDSKIDKLFSSPKAPTSSSIAQAASFLDKINLGSFFSPADLYNPLAIILPREIKEDELYTAILLTDGEPLVKPNARHNLLRNWTWQNNGNVALFTIAMGSDMQLANLDVASVLNKGRLSYSPTKRGLKRKLLKLMKNIHAPIAKNILCKAVSVSSKSRIKLYPEWPQTPHLYLNQPFVIMGSSDTMDDFILFVQGRLKDRWLNIKKPISFLHAKKGGSALKQEWALQQAYECYERYLIDNDPSHLAAAKELLSPYDIQIAFE